MKSKIIVLLLAIVIGQSCQKSDDIQPDNIMVVNRTDEMQIGFAKILSKALSECEEMRNFLKEEAMKQFDMDYDVLYQMVKDAQLGNGKTFSELLSQYEGSEEILVAVENELPLLTIFVPELPDFSAEKWNTATEVPKVAVVTSSDGDVPVFDTEGNKTSVPVGCVPAFPVVVIKQNERVLIDSQSALKTGLIDEKQEDFYENDRYSFSFMDKAFDGINNVFNKEKSVYINDYMDPRCIEAYNLGMQWHRDYIYYGLTPTNTTGSLVNNYSEFVTMMRFKNGADYSVISDQTEDPGLIKFTKNPAHAWTEGSFEFRMIVCINSKNGLGTEVNKFFTAKGSDLFDVKYRLLVGNFYLLESITPKTFNPNIELLPWDLNSYSIGWKVLLYEVDPSQTVTQSYSVTSSFATNFGFNSNDIVKIGLTFGGSSQTSTTNSYQVVTTYDSDYLGDATLTFNQPVITKVTRFFVIKIYNTREISTGIVDLCIEPQKTF